MCNEQLWGAIAAVFDSWESDRARVYRRLNDIPADWGTAVNVQAMVFGNMGETSATGVAFTRDPATGTKSYYGEWLVNAQGEDVVAGIRTPQYLTKAAREAANAKPLSMEEAMPGAYGELAAVFELLEKHYADMQDIEFTVEQGKLWMLQTRSGKRTAKAALENGGRHGVRGPDRPGHRNPPHRSDGARPAAASHARPDRAARCADARTAGIARSCLGRGGVRCRYRRTPSGTR